MTLSQAFQNLGSAVRELCWFSFYQISIVKDMRLAWLVAKIVYYALILLLGLLNKAFRFTTLTIANSIRGVVRLVTGVVRIVWGLVASVVQLTNVDSDMEFYLTLLVFIGMIGIAWVVWGGGKQRRKKSPCITPTGRDHEKTKTKKKKKKKKKP
jgi:hypothetical protein